MGTKGAKGDAGGREGVSLKLLDGISRSEAAFRVK